MRIYIIEDKKIGPICAFLHKQAAEDYINNSTDNVNNSSSTTLRIVELELNKSKRIFKYRSATIKNM